MDEFDNLVVQAEDLLEVLSMEEKNLLGELELVRERKKRANAMIRAATNNPRQKAVKVKQMDNASNKSRASNESREFVLEAIKGINAVHQELEGVGGSFSTKTASQLAGLNRSTTARALDQLRTEGVIRQVGVLQGPGSPQKVYCLMEESNG